MIQFKTPLNALKCKKKPKSTAAAPRWFTTWRLAVSSSSRSSRTMSPKIAWSWCAAGAKQCCKSAHGSVTLKSAMRANSSSRCSRRWTRRERRFKQRRSARGSNRRRRQRRRMQKRRWVNPQNKYAALCLDTHYVLTHLRIVVNGQRMEEEAAKVRKYHKHSFYLVLPGGDPVSPPGTGCFDLITILTSALSHVLVWKEQVHWETQRT